MTQCAALLGETPILRKSDSVRVTTYRYRFQSIQCVALVVLNCYQLGPSTVKPKLQ
jgi:hypothetical protein